MKRSKPKRMSPPTYLSVALNRLCAAECIAIRARISRAVLRTWRQMMLNARPRRLGYMKKKRGGPKLVFVQYGFCRESKRHYEQSRAGTRIYIGYALESWRQLQLERSRAGLADGCSYPNGRCVTIESYLLILPYVPLTNRSKSCFALQGGVLRSSLNISRLSWENLDC